MFLDDPKARKALTKWAVGTVAACILIFLGVRYISSIALAIEWLVSLVKPLLIGAMLAMILSVPLDFIEKHLFRRKSTPSKEKARRPVAILLSLLLVIGIFAGIAVLVIPELTGAISIVVSSITGAMEQLALLDSSADLSQFPFAQQLSVLDIDWLSLKAESPALLSMVLLLLCFPFTFWQTKKLWHDRSPVWHGCGCLTVLLIIWVMYVPSLAMYFASSS